jgi:hypothetical protein
MEWTEFKAVNQLGLGENSNSANKQFCGKDCLEKKVAAKK